MSNLVPGDRVFHPSKKEWGVGKVLGVTPDQVDVFFVAAGNKRLSRQYVTLERAEGDAARHSLLDNLTVGIAQSSSEFLTFPAAIQKFVRAYPGGFDGPRFLAEERNYKVKAHQLCVQLLGEQEVMDLVEEQKYTEICDRARKVEAGTNLLASFEKIKFNEALKHPDVQKSFAEGLVDLLYGCETEEMRFSRFVTMLDRFGIAKWPVATYFGYIRFPSSRIFIKPEVTQLAASLCGWEIGYRSEPNWRTYGAVLGLFNYMRDELIKAEMPPRDMIDVQSFIWCSAQ